VKLRPIFTGNIEHAQRSKIFTQSLMNLKSGLKMMLKISSFFEAFFGQI